MKIFKRLPLYLGLSMFVLSVLVSAVKIGEVKNLTYNRSRASVAGANLTMRFLLPDLVNVSLTSDKAVSGTDIVITFDREKIEILSSTLISGPAFITTGGVVDEENSTFSFSALPKTGDVRAGLIASFQVVPKDTSSEVSTGLEFLTGQGNTVVLEKDSGNNILTTAEGVTFNLSP